jgi:hypothetical protein
MRQWLRELREDYIDDWNGRVIAAAVVLLIAGQAVRGCGG